MLNPFTATGSDEVIKAARYKELFSGYSGDVCTEITPAQFYLAAGELNIETAHFINCHPTSGKLPANILTTKVEGNKRNHHFSIAVRGDIKKDNIQEPKTC